MAAEKAVVPILKVVRVGKARLHLPPIDCSHHAAAVAAHLVADADRETFIAIHLDTKLRLLSAEVVAVGTLAATLVHPREVFKAALLANAAALVLAHVHPSGDPTPSRDDIELTRRLAAAGTLLGIDVLDHIVVGHGRYASFRELGLL